MKLDVPKEHQLAQQRTGMLFFDPLNLYLHPDDPKAQAAIAAEGIIQRMEQINRACRAAGIAVFYAQADHRPDGRDFSATIVDRDYLGRSGDPPRFSAPPRVRAGTAGAEIIPEIAPQPADYVIKKHRWSSFYETHLELSLRTAGIDTIILAGGSTEIGIASTAYSARDRDFNIIILRDACRSHRAGCNDLFMNTVFPIFARVLTVEQVIAMMHAS